jgi:hypothetical protein
MAQNRISHVVVVRHFAAVENQAVLELAGIAEHGPIAHDDVLANVAACANLGVFANPCGAFDHGVGFNDGAFINEYLRSNEGRRRHGAEDTRFESTAKIVTQSRQGGPHRLLRDEKFGVGRVREVEVI